MLDGSKRFRIELVKNPAAIPGINHDAGLVLADEPTAHLDRATASAVTESLLDLAVGRTLIVATHDPELASRMDRTIHLAATGAPEERT